jgi:hypothetical protein
MVAIERAMTRTDAIAAGVAAGAGAYAQGLHDALALAGAPKNRC